MLVPVTEPEARAATTLDDPPRWLRLVACAVRLSLLVSPTPAAKLIRAVFARTGAARADGLAPALPPEGAVRSVVDERYGEGPDERVDVHVPAGADAPPPVVVWVHGGAFVGGS